MVSVSMAAPGDQPGGRTPDHVVPAWYRGMPVVMRSFELKPGLGFMREADVPPADELPYQRAVSYVVGVVDSAIGASPHQVINLPRGRQAVMPGHQAVLPCLGRPDAPILGVAYSVIPGPKATRFNLRTDPMPESSLIGAPLATAIRVGPSWVALNNHEVITLGLARDILRLRFFGANPVGWATPAWGDNYPFDDTLLRRCEAPVKAPAAYVMPSTAAQTIPAH